MPEQSGENAREVDAETKELKQRLARRLRALRKRRGETQPVTAEAVGMTANGYQFYEQESSSTLPGLANLVRIANHFGVTLDDLIGRQPNWDAESFDVLLRPEFGIADVDFPTDYCLADYQYIGKLESMTGKQLLKEADRTPIYFQTCFWPADPSRRMRYSRIGDEFRRNHELTARAKKSE